MKQTPPFHNFIYFFLNMKKDLLHFWRQFWISFQKLKKICLQLNFSLRILGISTKSTNFVALAAEARLADPAAKASKTKADRAEARQVRIGSSLTSSKKDGHDGEQDSQESPQKFHPV